MVADGVDRHLVLIGCGVAVEEPVDHFLSVAVGRFDFAVGGNHGAKQVGMVHADLQRTCGALRESGDGPILGILCGGQVGFHPVDHVLRQVGQRIAVHLRIHA